MISEDNVEQLIALLKVEYLFSLYSTSFDKDLLCGKISEKNDTNSLYFWFQMQSKSFSIQHFKTRSI